MFENKNQLVYGFLFLGLLLVGISTYFAVFAPQENLTEIRLASVDRETGKVFVLRSGYTQKETVDRKAFLSTLDSVETMETGEALLSFESAHKVRLLNNTFVTLERVEESQSFFVVLIIKRGEILIEGMGRAGELFIAKNGQRIGAAQYHQSALSQEPVEPEQASSSMSTPASANSGLSEDEINTVMANHRSSFFRCYTQLLQKDPTAKGNVSLSFTVENNGKLSVADVTASELKNEDFKKCLLEVLRRIEFRSFRGPAISTLFPLKFE